jgi:hypothetical protein
LALFAILFATPPSFAVEQYSTSDLNLIPTTETLEEGTAEWDVTQYLSEDLPRGRRLVSRLFVGLFNNFEFGMKWGLNRTGGPVELGAKWKVLDEYDSSFPVSLAVGADRITGNAQRTGYDPTIYVVLGVHDLRAGGWWDWFIGYANNPTGFDDEDNSLFGGFRYWFSDNTQLNVDYHGYLDNEDGIITGGLQHDFAKHLGLQAWVEHDTGTEDSIVVVELRTRADFRDLTAAVSDPE